MNLERKRAIWLRLLPVCIGVVLLYVVLRGLPLHALAQALTHMRIGWFAAALAFYGAIFLPASWRWHLVLKLSKKAVGFAQTLKVSLIGHFFYTLCFGVVGGDSAKAVIYAQRFGFSRTSILATAPLDRLMGFIGSAAFTAAALVVGLLAGAFHQTTVSSIQSPIHFLVWASLLGAAAALVSRRLKSFPAVQRFLALLRANLRLLIKSPRALFTGFGCGFLVQLALSAALGCNLAAVSGSLVPWQRILWTFPFIIAISALPVSIGGLGTREGAALVLWTAYGIPTADAIAASLLTLAVALVWAAFGGLLLLVAENKRRASYWRAVSKGDAGFPQKIQSSQSGKLVTIADS